MKQDILNRQDYVDDLINIVETIADKHDSYCFAINGKWGIGKTFVLEMFEEKLKNIPAIETADNKFFVFHYNCWKYDYYSEPSIAIISAILDECNKENAKLDEITDKVAKASMETAIKTIQKIAGEFSKNKIGINLVDIAKDIKKNYNNAKQQEHNFDILYNFTKTLENARSELKNLANKKAIVIVVDELDRCLPNYAIKVMERLHHLFDGIENITVILSVDSEQLNYSVQQIYGDNVDVDKYLRKFIDFTLVLNEGILSKDFMNKYNNYFSCFNIFDEYDINIFKDIYDNIVIKSNIDIRTQEKIMSKALLIHDLIDAENKQYDFSLAAFEIMYLVFLENVNIADLKDIINGCILLNTKIVFESEAEAGHMYNYLKNWSESVVEKCSYIDFTYNDGRRTTKKVLSSNISGKIMWLFSTIYYPIVKSYCCNNVYYKYCDEIAEEVKLAKEFTKLAQILY